jgi:hypothetical protein
MLLSGLSSDTYFFLFAGKERSKEKRVLGSAAKANPEE